MSWYHTADQDLSPPTCQLPPPTLLTPHGPYTRNPVHLFSDYWLVEAQRGTKGKGKVWHLAVVQWGEQTWTQNKQMGWIVRGEVKVDHSDQGNRFDYSTNPPTLRQVPQTYKATGWLWDGDNFPYRKFKVDIRHWDREAIVKMFVEVFRQKAIFDATQP